MFQAIADTYRINPYSFDGLLGFYDVMIEQRYFLEQRQRNKQLRKSDYDKISFIENNCCVPMIVHGSYHSERQRWQAGSYLLFPNDIDTEKHEFIAKIDELPKGSEMISQRFLIRSEFKKGTMEELRFCGITEATLFPDSIPIVCKDIVRYCEF